jgi:DNA (cytosine-5)-methyltransferase 1
VVTATASPGPVIGSLCTGYGGLGLGVLAAFDGGRIAWCADSDPHIATILAARMPGVLNLGDVRAIDWTSVEPVEVLTAGFPCQDISAAGRRAGIENGTRSGLWTDIVAGIRVRRPALLVVENVAALRWENGGLYKLLGDLAEAGYDALWRSVRAADIGAAHRRERVFLLAWPRTRAIPDVAHAAGARRGSPWCGRPDPSSSTRTAGESARRGECSCETAAHEDRFRREELHAHDGTWWTVAARRGAAVADGKGVGRRHGGVPGRCRVLTALVATGAPAGRSADVPPDAARDRRDEGRARATRLQRGLDVAFGSDAPDGAGGWDTGGRRHLAEVPAPSDHDDPACGEVNWSVYTPVVRRWEQVLGRSAPFPTQPGRHGRPVLAPAFVEWLQELEPGWVTGLALLRTAELRALGNGVVPQQAAHAVGLRLADLTAVLGTAELDASADHLSDWREAKTA